jgi:hypothetical protein
VSELLVTLRAWRAYAACEAVLAWAQTVPKLAANVFHYNIVISAVSVKPSQR